MLTITVPRVFMCSVYNSCTNVPHPSYLHKLLFIIYYPILYLNLALP